MPRSSVHRQRLGEAHCRGGTPGSQRSEEDGGGGAAPDAEGKRSSARDLAGAGFSGDPLNELAAESPDIDALVRVIGDARLRDLGRPLRLAPHRSASGSSSEVSWSALWVAADGVDWIFFEAGLGDEERSDAIACELRLMLGAEQSSMGRAEWLEEAAAALSACGFNPDLVRLMLS